MYREPWESTLVVTAFLLLVRMSDNASRLRTGTQLFQIHGDTYQSSSRSEHVLQMTSVPTVGTHSGWLVE